MASKKEREEVRELLNKAVNIEESEEGHTMEVSLKNFEALVGLIRVLQTDYNIGIGGTENLFRYELGEDIRVPEEE